MTLPVREVPYTFFPEAREQNDTEMEIYGFANLPAGWHYGEGGPIPTQVIRLALALHQYALALGFQTTEAFPGIGGEIMVSIYRHGHALDLTITPGLRIDLRHEVQDEELQAEDGLSPDLAMQKINEFRQMTWKSSGSFTPNTSVENKVGSNPSLSSPAAKEEASPSLTRTVPWKPVRQFAHI